MTKTKFALAALALALSTFGAHAAEMEKAFNSPVPAEAVITERDGNTAEVSFPSLAICEAAIASVNLKRGATAKCRFAR